MPAVLALSVRRALPALLLAASAAAQAAGIAVQVTNDRGAALADAVVYALPASGKAPPAAPGTRAVIDQIDREFVPLVSVIQAGTSVSFPNKDNVEHDVYSFSAPKRFEIRLYSGVPSRPVLFDKPGLVTLGCNIHDSMVAWVLVVDTPYFAKTDKAGRAFIDGLPPGAWRVVAWHNGLRDPNGQRSQAATMPETGNGQALKFSLAADNH